MKPTMFNILKGGNMKPILTLTALLLASCAMQTSQADIDARNARLTEFYESRPVCESEADCKVKWDAAQVFVANHSAFKIQTATDVLIQTYGPTQTGVDLAIKVTKEPMDGERYEIVFKAWCNNPFGCAGDPINLGVQFNYKVAATSA